MLLLFLTANISLRLCICHPTFQSRNSSIVCLSHLFSCHVFIYLFIAGSLESAYSLNWGAREIWGKGGGETLALL